MSTYSNEPQQNIWEVWFITSIISFLVTILWGVNSEDLPIIYDALLLATFVNLVYCIYIGVKK